MKRVSGFDVIDEETQERMKALSAMPDDQIDFSEIPEWTPEDFASAVPFHSIWRARKTQITARIDADILVWLKSHGKGYQTLMNNLLRKEMIKEQKKMA